MQLQTTFLVVVRPREQLRRTYMTQYIITYHVPGVRIGRQQTLFEVPVSTGERTRTT